jgi:hypothetical protein
VCHRVLEARFWGADRLVDTQAIPMAEHKKWCAIRQSRMQHQEHFA